MSIGSKLYKFELYRKLRIPIKEFLMDWDRKKFQKRDIYEAPAITENAINLIENELENDSAIKDHIYHVKISKLEYEKFENELGFQHQYDKKYSDRYASKILEYYLADSILDFGSHVDDPSYQYIDAASANSPWAMWLRKKYGISAYSVDLLEPNNDKEYYIKGDVTDFPFDDNSVDAISMQSALETFPEKVDVDFIKDAGRILRKGGELLITPLYLSTVYANCFGKQYYDRLEPDMGAQKYIRFGYSGPTTRLYDVDHLKSRILESGLQVGLDFNVLIFDMDTLMIDSWDKYMYTHFGLLFRKL